jgi:hypothetical protein
MVVPNSSRPPGMFQVAFDLPQVSATWPPFRTERIWAKTHAPYQLELQNIPFFVRGVSCGDIIRAKPDHERRELVFDGLVSHSEHSTIRVILRDKSQENRARILEFVRAAGCSWDSQISIFISRWISRRRLITVRSEPVLLRRSPRAR